MVIISQGQGVRVTPNDTAGFRGTGHNQRIIIHSEIYFVPSFNTNSKLKFRRRYLIELQKQDLASNTVNQCECFIRY